MATYPMSTSTNDLLGGAVHDVLGALETSFSLGSLDIYPFQSVFLPFDENQLTLILNWDLTPNQNL